MTSLAVLSLVLALGAGADDSLKKDLEQLQGTWTVVSMEMDGKFLSEERRKKTKVTV